MNTTTEVLGDSSIVSCAGGKLRRALCALIVVSTTTTIHAQVGALRSTDLKEILDRNGFDQQQQAIILDAHKVQVERFVECVRSSTAAWTAALREVPSDQAAANALVARGRAAASDLDAVEAPVSDAIRRVARADQSAAVEQSVADLEQRRNLAIWTAALIPNRQPRKVDWERVATKIPLTVAQRRVLEERLRAQTGERLAATRLMRDVALQLPLARIKSQSESGGFPIQLLPPPAQAIPQDAKENDGGDLPAEASDEAVVQTVDPDLGKQLLIAMLSRGQDGMKAVSAVRARLSECDAQLIDELLPQLNGRSKLQLLSNRAIRSRAGQIRSTVALLARVANEIKDLDDERVTRIDAVLDRWAEVWWPAARQTFVSAAPRSVIADALVEQGDAAKRATQQRASEATAGAIKEIAAIVPESASSILANLKPAIGSRLVLPKDDGVAFEAVAAPGVAQQDGQPPAIVVEATAISVSSERLDGEQLDSVAADLAADLAADFAADFAANFAADFAADFAVDHFEVQGLASIDEDGADAGRAVVNDGLGHLFGVGSMQVQRPIQIDQIEASLIAGGVGADLMPAVEQILQDAEASVATRRQKVEMGSVGAGDFDPAFFVSGGVRRKEMEQRANESYSEATAAREAIFAAEKSAFDSSVMPLTDAKRVSAVAWIVPWRELAKERAAAPGMSIVSFEPTAGGASDRGDPMVAVLRAQLTSEDWCALGPTLAAECNNLLTLTRAWTSADESERQIVPRFAEISLKKPQVISAERQMAIRAAAERTQAAEQALRAAYGPIVQRLKTKLAPESAQRLQDAWDDQRFSRELRDTTSLTSRFDAAEALVKGAELEAANRALRSARETWSQQSIAIRSQIIAECERRSAESQAIIQALRYQRDEWNLTMLQRLREAIGPDLAARIPPLD